MYLYVPEHTWMDLSVPEKQSKPQLKCVKWLIVGEEFYRDAETKESAGEMEGAVQDIVIIDVIDILW